MYTKTCSIKFENAMDKIYVTNASTIETLAF
jgi:hypothetical protein